MGERAHRLITKMRKRVTQEMTVAVAIGSDDYVNELEIMWIRLPKIYEMMVRDYGRNTADKLLPSFVEGALLTMRERAKKGDLLTVRYASKREILKIIVKESISRRAGVSKDYITEKTSTANCVVEVALDSLSENGLITVKRRNGKVYAVATEKGIKEIMGEMEVKRKKKITGKSKKRKGFFGRLR